METSLEKINIWEDSVSGKPSPHRPYKRRPSQGKLSVPELRNTSEYPLSFVVFKNTIFVVVILDCLFKPENHVLRVI